MANTPNQSQIIQVTIRSIKYKKIIIIIQGTISYLQYESSKSPLVFLPERLALGRRGRRGRHVADAGGDRDDGARGTRGAGAGTAGGPGGAAGHAHLHAPWP